MRSGEAGPAGANGLKGRAGIVGIQGQTGEPGIKGLPGQRGPKGISIKGERGSDGDYKCAVFIFLLLKLNFYRHHRHNW